MAVPHGHRPVVVPFIRPTFGLSYYSQTYGVSGAAVQRALAERGYYYGVIDGIIGPRSRDAIADFQSDAGLAVTGEINYSLLRELDL